MIKTHLIDEHKIGVEFSYYCKLYKKVEFIKNILSFYDRNSMTYSVIICGLDFNVEKLVSLLSKDSHVVEGGTDETNDGMIEKTIITTNQCDLDVFLNYLDKFSEGSYKLNLFETATKCSGAVNELDKSLLSISVFSDATYLELFTRRSFPKNLIESIK